MMWEFNAPFLLYLTPPEGPSPSRCLKRCADGPLAVAPKSQATTSFCLPFLVGCSHPPTIFFPPGVPAEKDRQFFSLKAFPFKRIPRIDQWYLLVFFFFFFWYFFFFFFVFFFFFFLFFFFSMRGYSGGPAEDQSFFRRLTPPKSHRCLALNCPFFPEPIFSTAESF